MQIVIDIPDILMEYIVKGKDLSDEQNDEMAYAIADGIQLPKGHGDLIDRQLLIDNGTEKGFCDWYDEIKYADAIVEADKEI